MGNKKGVIAVVSPRVKGKTKDEAIVNSIGRKVFVDIDSVEYCQCGARVPFCPENGGRSGFILVNFLIARDENLIKLGAQPS